MFHLQVTSTTMELLPLVCVSLLTWSGTTFADENGPAVIKMVEKEDSDVILPCSLGTTDIKQALFDWKKDGRKEVYMYDAGTTYNDRPTGQDQQFRGRVSHFPEQLEFGNASIIIKNAKVTDSGKYTCDFPRLQPNRRSNIELVVGAAPKPSVKSLKQTADWALLQCEVRGAFPKPKLHWQDSDGNILHAEEPQVSEQGGRFCVTLQITVNKTDYYRCVATQEEISHQIYEETHEYINGAATKPYVTIIDETADWALLQCEVRGAFPKPKLHWQDRDGNILHAEEPKVSERGGSYDVILQTTVTKTDNYRCVATQEEINHHTDVEIYVYMSGLPTGLFVGSILGSILGGLFVGILLGAGYCILQKHKKDKGSGLRNSPLNQQEAFPA